jgi:peptide/nickel transport system substrate-binding protein
MELRHHLAGRRKPLGTGAVLVAAAALALTACSTTATATAPASSAATTASVRSGGSITFAEPPDATPNWILPLDTPSHLASYNLSIQAELYLPLVQYDTRTGALALDYDASAASKVAFSKGDTAVTVTLGDRKWSDGAAVTSRDVQFWFDLIKANKDQWGDYTKGEIPDNIKSFKIDSTKTFTFGLTEAVNPEWFMGNQLAEVTPLPQQVWDRESQTGKVGNYDLTATGAHKVWDFLVSAATNINGYDSSQLWRVTDGPFKLSSWSTDGQVTLQKSKSFSGPGAAHLSSVTEVPFTSSTAEFDDLRAGDVDYGYVPASDLSEVSYLKSQGYSISPWDGWAINYAPYNFNNPALGPALRQLYVRQAIQMGIDQSSIAKVVWGGDATPVYGPVPQHPKSAYLSSTQARNPYPYDPEKARRLLSSHGWKESGGVMVCVRPGTTSSECGTGVKKGTELRLHMLSESGSTETTEQMEALQSQLSEIGVGFVTSYAPLNEVLSEATQCKPSAAACSWQLSFFGTQGSWYFSPYPSGAALFSSDGAANFGNYDSATANTLATESHRSSNPVVLREWSAYLAEQLPVMWLPLPAYQVSVIKTNLHVQQNPLAGTVMQFWYLTK